MGLGGWHVSPSLRYDKFVGVVGGNILNGENLDNFFGELVGDGRGGSKSKGVGLRIAATLFFHEHVIFLQRIVVLQGRTKKKRSDKAIPAATNSDDPYRVCPPAGWRGWMYRGSPILLKRRTISEDVRHARTVLRHSDASDLCPIPGAVASFQILQTPPPHKCPGGHDKDNDG